MTVPARTNTTVATAEVLTTKDVRTGYALSKLNGQLLIDAADVLDGASVAFDRWLAAHDAQVWAEGAECAIDHPTWRAASIRAANPYRADAMTRQADAPAADDEGGQDPTTRTEVEWGVACPLDDDIIPTADPDWSVRHHDRNCGPGHSLVRRTVTDWTPAEEPSDD